jgi:hypothetical protein
MSVDVAIQGIAQDYVTLLVGTPSLFIGHYKYNNYRILPSNSKKYSN